jgi:hypothetical protein
MDGCRFQMSQRTQRLLGRRSCDPEIPAPAIRVQSSCPPFAVPPSSLRAIVIVALPLALGAGVNVKVPEGLTAGAVENKAALGISGHQE